MSRSQRYFDPNQPQTLQIAVFLLYFDAALLILGGGAFSGIGLVLIAAYGGSAYGIANGKKLGYKVGVAVAVFALAAPFIYNSLDVVVRFATIELMFAIALVCLLLHPQSREYQRFWFS